MMTKRRIIIVIIVVLLIIGIYQIFFTKEKSTFTLAEIVRGNIIQEVSETGQVKKGEEINLSFKNSGEIKEINVKTGDNVESGQVLAKLDTSELEIQLAEVKAGLTIIEAEKRDAQISLENARQKLEDTIVTTDEKIEKDYKEAMSVLDDSYVKAYNALNFVDLLKRTYFGRGDVDSINVSESGDKIDRAVIEIKSYIDKSKNSQKKEDIDTAFLKTKEDLWRIKTAIEDIRSTIEAGNYRDIVSSADKNTLDTHKTNINTAHSNVVSSQAEIALDKTTNTAQINSAQSEVSVLENQLQGEGNNLYEARINQAKAKIQLLENQISDSYLKSPTRGQIARINKRAGEMVQPTAQDVVISLLPASPFEINVDIYEEDVVKLNIGNPVDISLVAIAEKIFKGKVVSIDPAEEIIEGVVYYKVKIIFEDDVPESLKPGMTADVMIKTASKEGVLIVPEVAIQEKEGKKIIQVLKNKKIENREIETGLEGSDGMIEIISGIEEGEKVIVK